VKVLSLAEIGLRGLVNFIWKMYQQEVAEVTGNERVTKELQFTKKG
jgi:hypothetical protein